MGATLGATRPGGPPIEPADPLANAKAAVGLSADGGDWSLFPGYQRGIYRQFVGGEPR